MGNRRALFYQDDVKRAAKGVLTAGLPIEHVKIDRDGSIVVFVGEGTANRQDPNDWDE